MVATIMEIKQEAAFDFEKFTEKYSLKITKIGVECSNCGRYWNVHLTSEKTLDELHETRLICSDCKELKRKKIMHELGY